MNREVPDSDLFATPTSRNDQHVACPSIGNADGLNCIVLKPVQLVEVFPEEKICLWVPSF
jgi:hypothetical protein